MEGNEGNAFCINCGAKLRENAKFCPKCGAKRFSSAGAASNPTPTPVVPSVPAPAPTTPEPAKPNPVKPEPSASEPATVPAAPSTNTHAESTISSSFELPTDLADLLKAAQPDDSSDGATPTASASVVPAVPTVPVVTTVPVTDTASTAAPTKESTPTKETVSPFPEPSSERMSYQWASTTEAPKKSGGFWDKLDKLYTGVGTVQCIVFGLLYLIGGVVAAFQGYWAGLLGSAYGVYLLWPSDHFKLLIW